MNKTAYNPALIPVKITVLGLFALIAGTIWMGFDLAGGEPVGWKSLLIAIIGMVIFLIGLHKVLKVTFSKP